MLGVYKAINIRVLEVEAEIASIRITLDKAILRYYAIRGTHPVTKVGNTRIRERLHKKRGRKQEIIITPVEKKESWALRVLQVDAWADLTSPDKSRNTGKARREVRKWRDKK